MHNKLMGCLLGGAVGDALGAPVEVLFSLEKIRAAYGAGGIRDLSYYDSSWEAIEQKGVGAITDDTTMCLTTLAAMLMAKDDMRFVHHYAWQGYLNWGAKQEAGEGLTAHIDLRINWIDTVKPFWFGCGAGRGTIAALQTGKCGTTDDPVMYDTEIRGKKIAGPNDGCGGMMRVAPLAFLRDDSFRLGIENAAITHAGETAQLASGAVALMVERAAAGDSLDVFFNHLSARLYAEGGAMQANACALAWEASRLQPTMERIDAIPLEVGAKNKFLAMPVLAQTIYALGAVHHHGLGFKDALILAVNHSGDSDSVGAIVGNILGARSGADALPQDWVQKIQLHKEIEELGRKAARELKAFAP